MKVSDAMHMPPVRVRAETPVSEIAARMAKDVLGAVPIGRDDRLGGMITDRDLALRIVAERREPDMTLAVEDTIRLMDHEQTYRLPALDENKRLDGMLRLGTIAHAASLQPAGELTRTVSTHHR